MNLIESLLGIFSLLTDYLLITDRQVAPSITTLNNNNWTSDYEVVGSIEVNTFENSLFVWEDIMYVLENIACGYSQHASNWFPEFKNSSYARIRIFETGEIVVNITSTIGYGFITPFPDYDHGKLWLFGSSCNRCVNNGRQGCKEDRGITAWRLEGNNMDISTRFETWKKKELIIPFQTYNVQVTAVHPTTTTNPKDLPPHRYALIAEALPFQFFVNNNENGDLFHDWMSIKTKAPARVGVGGPSIRYLDGWYYILTGGHYVELVRTRDFQKWQRSSKQPFIQPTPMDAKIAPYNGFPSVTESRGFGPMHKDYKLWDYNSNDADVAYLPVDDMAWIIWGAGTQGGHSRPPVKNTNRCTNVVGFANMSLSNLFRHHFESMAHGDVQVDV